MDRRDASPPQDRESSVGEIQRLSNELNRIIDSLKELARRGPPEEQDRANLLLGQALVDLENIVKKYR